MAYNGRDANVPMGSQADIEWSSTAAQNGPKDLRLSRSASGVLSLVDPNYPGGPGADLSLGSLNVTNSTERLVTLSGITPINVDPASGNIYAIYMDGDTTINMLQNTAGNTAMSVSLVLTHVGSGHNVTWGAEILWPNATTPTLSSSTDLITLLSVNQGTTWHGITVGVNY